MHRPTLMLLYHVNVGYPVVAPGARLLAPDAEVVARDAPAAALLAEHAAFPPPQDGFEQLVYEHRLREPDVDRARASGSMNPSWEPTGGIGLVVEYDPRQLPHLWQWRMLAPGMYLTGLEPATCGILGRAVERERGTLVTLEPGERRPFDVGDPGSDGERRAGGDRALRRGTDSPEYRRRIPKHEVLSR